MLEDQALVTVWLLKLISKAESKNSNDFTVEKVFSDRSKDEGGGVWLLPYFILIIRINDRNMRRLQEQWRDVMAVTYFLLMV